MGEWWSIEVSDGEFSAASWMHSHSRDLTRTALEHGASDWAIIERPWGVVLEVCFPDDVAAGGGWERFRAAAIVQAALDAVPDPVNGLIVYPGRGGSSAAPVPRRPKPAPTAAAAMLPQPEIRTQPADLAATVILAPRDIASR